MYFWKNEGQNLIPDLKMAGISVTGRSKLSYRDGGWFYLNLTGSMKFPMIYRDHSNTPELFISMEIYAVDSRRGQLHQVEGFIALHGSLFEKSDDLRT